MERKIEILAPAGSYEGMKAAMNAGCDAVYIGGSSFGARAYANNPEDETMLRAIDEAHIRNKQLYLTVNTLLKEKERTGELYRFLEKFYLQGLDAVIVQDVGVMHFIHKHFPQLPIHASTQMTLTMAQGANLLKDYGVTRIVTSREISLKEIKTIRENTDLEIETFVHGALCYCYSGQCLMSSIIGGRSGNRGRCAQPCRMPYQFHSENSKLYSEQDKYLLSPKDINTLAILPELIEAGIDSFKIEGRMKRPEYAAATSFLYRKYTDYYLEGGREKYDKLIRGEAFKEDMILLQDIYSRGGFSEGYGKTYHGKSMMSLVRPNHSGVYVGEVKDIAGSQVSIILRENVNAQDILEIRQNPEEGYEFTVKDVHEKGQILRTNVGRRYLNNSGEGKFKDSRAPKFIDPNIHIGDEVYRTKNNKLLEQLAADYMSKEQQLGITGILSAKIGKCLALTLRTRECSVTAYQGEVQTAQKQPMTKEKISSSLEKTGDTFYYFKELVIDCNDNIFVPVAWLNEIRREAINLLQEEVKNSYHRDKSRLAVKDIERESSLYMEKTAEDISHEKLGKIQENVLKKEDALQREEALRGENLDRNGRNNPFGISLSVQTKAQFELAISISETTVVIVHYDRNNCSEIIEMAADAKEKKKEFILYLPTICRLSVYEKLRRDLAEINDNENIGGYLVQNFEEVALLQSLFREGKQPKKIILNYNMYVYNKEAKEFWKEIGITDYTAPVELNYQELKTLEITDCDMIVYGYQPLMVSAQCLYESTGGCRKSNSGADNRDDSSTKDDSSKEDQDTFGELMDRLGKKFYVKTNCSSCYNVIYNGQALFLIKQEPEIRKLAPKNIRLDFTMESASEMKQVIAACVDTYCYGKKTVLEHSDYTTGHFKRGVE